VFLETNSSPMFLYFEYQTGLGAQYPVHLLDTAPLSLQLRTVLDGLARISQRMDALEDAISTAPKEVRSAVPLEGTVSNDGEPILSEI
jgi:hypothetical protein